MKTTTHNQGRWSATVLLALVGLWLTPCATAKTTDVDLDLLGASPVARALERDDTVPPSHFLSEARTVFGHAVGVSGFQKIGEFREIYPGINMACYGDEHHFEFSFILKVGADPSLIRLRLADVKTDGLSNQGTVVYSGDGFEVYEHAPAVFHHGQAGTRGLPGRIVLGQDGVSSVAMPSFFDENREEFNDTRFSIVTEGGGLFGPDYDFFMSKHETTNEQLIRFLNDAEANRGNARGENMFFDETGNVWINPEMQTGRDEMFQIDMTRIEYDPSRVSGDRYHHVMDDSAREPYADHPAIGISWFGAVKYCNWLTLQSGRSPSELCYTEGTNTMDWAPVTATNWANGFFSAGEREAWLKLKGFRLPMFRTYDTDETRTDEFNEFLKAGSWMGHTNVLFGYGRNTYTNSDANALDLSMAANTDTLPIGYFNGLNPLLGSRTQYSENHYGIHDLSGNVSEWVNDPARAGTPDARSACGGSYGDQIQPLTADRIVPPHACENFGGFRPVTTFMPDEYTQVNVLYCFHSPGGTPEEISDRFGDHFGSSGYGEVTSAALLQPGDITAASADPDETDDDIPASLTDATEAGEEDTDAQPAGIIYKEDDEDELEGIASTATVEDGDPTLTTYHLGVYSENSGSSVNIAVSTVDINGYSDGTTGFGRNYLSGQQVTITAPSTAGDNTFKWWLRNGIFHSTANSATEQMSDHVDFTAVYEDSTTCHLGVYSENPDSGVNIAVSTADIDGNSDGPTGFGRNYLPNDQITITAPTSVGENTFKWWLVNGSPESTANSITIQMLADLDCTAVYLIPSNQVYTLTIDSPNGNVPIDISRQDNNGQQNGSTTLSRLYDDGDTVTATAPATFGEEDFQGWSDDGTLLSPSRRSVTVTMSRDVRLTATYGPDVDPNERRLTVASSNPDSGIAVNVSLPDVHGDSDGSTLFQRIYNKGDTTTLTAPATVGDKTFSHWLRKGVMESYNPAVDVIMSTDIEMTAVYSDPPPDIILTVLTDPQDGTPITIGTPDKDGATDGNTSFTRRYDSGAVTTVTAPPDIDGGALEFVNWVINGTPRWDTTTINVSLLVDTELIAVYRDVPPTNIHNLVVQSQDPNNGVDISVNTPDDDSETDGSTTFTRRYEEGTEVVLTAPETAPNGNRFDYWELDDKRESYSRTISVAMYSQHRVRAVYSERPRYVLTVESRDPNSSVVVSIDKPDVNNQQNGSTTVTRLYEEDEVVTLTARNPAFPGTSNYLQQWLQDEVPTSESNDTITVTMRRDTTVTALYGEDPVTNDVVLTVESVEPDSGVNIQISQADLNGAGDGSTSFERDYAYNTPITATAPEFAPNGNQFQHWLRNGLIHSTELSINLANLSDITITAVYDTYITHILTVDSSNPGSGIDVQVSTADIHSAKDGATHFEREYEDGEPVTLVAPDFAPNGRDVFKRWERSNGAIVTTNTTVDLTMNYDIGVTAVYGHPDTFDLTVKSQNPSDDVNISISTPDIRGDTDGMTTFTRTYNSGEGVTVTAEETPDEVAVFEEWLINGHPDTNRTIHLTMLSDIELIAVYGEEPVYRSLIVRAADSVGPVEVTVDVSPADQRALSDGETAFERRYEDGDVVTVTAPPSVGEDDFLQWFKNGVPDSPNLTATVNMLRDHVMIAVYGQSTTNDTDRFLVVDSRNPNSGVPITVSQPDVTGNSDGDTVFIRTYTYGTTTTLTAPEQGGTNDTDFLHWERDGSIIDSPDRTVTIDMVTDLHLTAVYGDDPEEVTLTVNARDATNNVPLVDVAVSIGPLDLNGESGGKTEFQREYENGQTATLTAPGTAGGLPFSGWERRGILRYTNQTISVELLADVTMTAVYGGGPPPPVVTLTVFSKSFDSAGVEGSPGIFIYASPDNNANAGGPTSAIFERHYDSGESVILTAPPNAPGSLIFDRWESTGGTDSTPTVSFLMLADQTWTAVYIQDPGHHGDL